MALEQFDTDTIDAIRSLDAIQRDVADLERRDLGEDTGELDCHRRQMAMHLSGVSEGGEAWRAIVDEEAELDRLERDSIQMLESMRRRVLNDHEHLRNVPYRPALPADQTAAAEAKAAHLASRLPGMSAADVQRAIRGAVLFGDRPAMAAWAMLADAIETRFPNSAKVKDENGRDVYPAQLFRDLLRTCEAKTGDQQVVQTREKLEAQLSRINQRITAIAVARNNHNPTGGVGGVLLSHQFGRSPEDARRERRYDPQAVASRLGARS